MVNTGYISFITSIGGGVDTEGNMTQPSKTDSAYIPCNLKVVTKEYRILIDQDYQQASYSCYIESDLFNTLSIDLSTVAEIQLKDNNSNELGVFRNQNVEYLNLSKKIKLVV